MELNSDSGAARTVSAIVASERYVPELDGIRAVAVALVVFAHYRMVPYIPGGFGVTLFFFLSGYLITTLFYAEYCSSLKISIPRFYLRRWLRLTPTLVIFVLIAVVFHGFSRVALGGDPVPIGMTLAALLYYTNYYDLSWAMQPDALIPLGICWSLAVEEHFYLTWPWIVSRNIQHRRRLWLIIVSLCTVVLIWRCVARFGFTLSDDYTYMASDCRIDSILYGALLRVLFEAPRSADILKVLRSRICRIAAILTLLLTFVIRDENFRQTFRYTIQGIALMPVFTAVLTDSPKSLLRAALANKPMVLIGRLSYSIYLLHLLGRTPAEVYFGSPFGFGQVIIGLTLTLGSAYALFIFVERPIARLRHRYRTGGMAHSDMTPKSRIEAPATARPRESTPSI